MQDQIIRFAPAYQEVPPYALTSRIVVRCSGAQSAIVFGRCSMLCWAPAHLRDQLWRGRTGIRQGIRRVLRMA